MFLLISIFIIERYLLIVTAVSEIHGVFHRKLVGRALREENGCAIILFHCLVERVAREIVVQ